MNSKREKKKQRNQIYLYDRHQSIIDEIARVLGAGTQYKEKCGRDDVAGHDQCARCRRIRLPLETTKHECQNRARSNLAPISFSFPSIIDNNGRRK